MLKQTISILACSAILTASTTMCYKKNHSDPSTIEIVALDGGECASKFSVTDMKKDGYKVDTMKIQNGKNDEGLNYIYIFKKEDNTKITTTKAISTVALKAQLKQMQKENKKQKEIDESKISIEKGKKLYLNTCIRCHGKDAKEEAYNTARPLNSLTLEDMEVSIRDYGLSEKDNGYAMIMTPYADMLTSEDIKNVYNYLQTLKR